MQKTYEECKEIAQEVASQFNTTLSKAYTINNDYVFDTAVEVMGYFPTVIESETGNRCGLWRYLNDHDLTEYDMKEREL